ncbi:hypothetical protein P8Q88_04370 [Qipengyuania sp. XHP0207]|uniref:hypothetical protein n=1 Tax=Qipengyuania sp. XHP0207 TaxID=3038078 RepID=UPI00241E957F|nr:hypothetical protein [Qipengyuania sp. XHP0207]MDG5747406.1 hypothetical protein [Qipengyuania sp. XHP0207]
MVEVIPFMLFVLKILGDDPVAVTLERQPALFASEEECLAAADAMLDDIARRAHRERRDLRHWCLPVPGPDEFADLFEGEPSEARERS